MAGRGRSTFQKRKKEQTRLERRQQKAARRIERKAEKDNPLAETEPEVLELGPFPSEADLDLPTDTSPEDSIP
jgi:hypothetical protein